jgi:glycosyltransferase involved in cell wall biosynthesis
MLKIALISCHASPLAVAGSLDCGGVNLYVAQLGSELGALGCQVDIFTRRTRLEQPHIHYWRPNVRVIHVPAGPPGVPWGQSGIRSGVRSGTRSGAQFGAQSGIQSGIQSDTQPGAESGTECGAEPGVGSGYEPVTGSGTESGTESEKLVADQFVAQFVDQFARGLVAFARRQRGSYHILHAHDRCAGNVARAARHALGTPYVLTLHEHPQACLAAGHGGPPPQLPLVADADRVIALCPQQRQAFHAVAGTAHTPVDVVPWGFDPSVLWPVRLRARAALGLDSAAFVALQVAHLVDGHGIDAAIAGVAQLAVLHGVRARLLLVGAAAPGDAGGRAPSELTRLRALARQLDVAVTFAGPQPQAALRHWYSAADVYLATPRTASFGVTALEAMACATPVIGTRTGGLASTVVDGETGYLLPAHDHVALAERLAYLHVHPAHARSLGVQGWRRAHRHYTWRSVARRIEDIYAQVLAGMATDGAVDALPAMAAAPPLRATGGGNHGAPPASASLSTSASASLSAPASAATATATATIAATVAATATGAVPAQASAGAVLV